MENENTEAKTLTESEIVDLLCQELQKDSKLTQALLAFYRTQRNHGEL